MTPETTSGWSAAPPNVAKLEPEREHFQTLVLGNPNYFGNLEGHPSKLVKKLQQDTSYEELVCVGLNPDHDRLEAVLDVKREFGYGGNICAAGSRVPPARARMSRGTAAWRGSP